jgi:hypothetical protein
MLQQYSAGFTLRAPLQINTSSAILFSVAFFTAKSAM